MYRESHCTRWPKNNAYLSYILCRRNIIKVFFFFYCCYTCMRKKRVFLAIVFFFIRFSSQGLKRPSSIDFSSFFFSFTFIRVSIASHRCRRSYRFYVIDQRFSNCCPQPPGDLPAMLSIDDDVYTQIIYAKNQVSKPNMTENDECSDYAINPFQLDVQKRIAAFFAH